MRKAVRELKVENILEVRTEENKAVETENGEKVERKVNRKGVFGTISTTLVAAKPENGRVVERLTCTVRKYCFVRDILFSDLDDKYELDSGSALAEK